MDPLLKVLFLVVLLLPGGFLAAPVLWLVQRLRHRRAKPVQRECASA